MTTTTETDTAAAPKEKPVDLRRREGTPRLKREAAILRRSIKLLYDERQVGFRTRYENPRTWGEDLAWSALELLNVRGGTRTKAELQAEAEKILGLLAKTKGAHDFTALPLATRGHCLVLRINPAEKDHLDAIAAWKDNTSEAPYVLVDIEAEDNLFSVADDDAAYGSAPTSAPQTVSLAGITPRLAVDENVVPASTPPRNLFEGSQVVTPEEVESSNAALGYKPADVPGVAPFKGFAHQHIDLD